MALHIAQYWVICYDFYCNFLVLSVMVWNDWNQDGVKVNVFADRDVSSGIHTRSDTKSHTTRSLWDWGIHMLISWLEWRELASGFSYRGRWSTLQCAGWLRHFMLSVSAITRTCLKARQQYIRLFYAGSTGSI